MDSESTRFALLNWQRLSEVQRRLDQQLRDAILDGNWMAVDRLQPKVREANADCEAALALLNETLETARLRLRTSPPPPPEAG